MNKLLRLKKVLASLLVAGVVVPTAFHAASLHAQSAADSDQVVNLLVAAYDARDAGDLAAAKTRFERILQLDPNNSAARDGLADVNSALAARQSAQASTPSGFSFENFQPATASTATTAPTNVAPVTAPVPPPAPKTTLDRVAQKNEALYAEVQSALVEAKMQADAGNTARALQLIDGATRALPDNTGSQDLKARLDLLRQQVVAVRDSGGMTALERDADSVLATEKGLNQRAVAEAMRLVDDAKGQIKRGELDDADATLAKATQILPRNIATVDKSDEIRKAQSMLLAVRMHKAIDARDITSAEGYLNDYGRLNGETDKGYLQLKEEFEAKKADPRYLHIASASPGFEQLEAKIQELTTRGRAQYLYGDYEGALATFKDVLQRQTYNAEAKAHIIRIKNILARSGAWNRQLVKSDLLGYVDNQWVLPGVYDKEVGSGPAATEEPVIERLKKTIIPTITLRDAPLSRAIETLAELSVMYDPEQKGVNMVVFDPENKNPNVSITMKNVSLDRLLEFVSKSATFNYSVNNGIIEVRPDVGTGDVETEILPITTGAIVKMTGMKTGGGGSEAADPFGGGGGGGGDRPEEAAIKGFLQRSGIPFDTVQGSALSYSGAEIIVTQNRRNLEKIKNILRRYADTKQVHIESKFLEVQEGALRQLSSNFIVERTRNGTTEVRARTGLRTLSDTFGASGVSNPGQIITTPSASSLTDGAVIGDTVTLDIPNTPPAFPQGNTGPSEPTFDGIIGSIGNWDLRLVVAALEENEGSDLMAAPSVTVVSGESATITIAQKLRYPESYGDIQSNVGSSSSSSSSSYSGSGASVTITAGTPQDFREEEVGVKMTVTPTVMDGGLIKLDLFPKVVEFEGFVEYGGTSVAIAGNTTVTVPSGFFQPIFSVREVMTKVEIFDGATVVIGGLTREEVKTVNDKVPVLGDLPILGAMFQSNGRSSTKKNLMIFVTANLISPGGSTATSRIGNITPGATFANPQVFTPGGPVSRQVVEATPASGAR